MASARCQFTPLDRHAPITSNGRSMKLKRTLQLAGTCLWAIVLAGCADLPVLTSDSPGQVSIQNTFTNPVLRAGADPWVTSKDGFYYYMHTTGRNLTVWKTRSIPDLKDAERKVVWRPPPSGPYSKDIWAPEIHFLEGKSYIYFAADDGNNPTHR